MTTLPCARISYRGSCPDPMQEVVVGMDGVERGFCAPHAYEARGGADLIARKVQEMLRRRQRDELKRTANDFISGLIEAYALVTGTPQNEALDRIMEV